MSQLRILVGLSTFATATLLSPVSSFSPGSVSATRNRHEFFASLLSGLTGTAILKPNIVEASIEPSSIQTTSATDTSIFLGGTYTDPNHPGGTRTIEPTGTGFAGYQVVAVKGGGGSGEPESYELPGLIFKCPGNGKRGGKYCISIDFTPKGGPRDLQGYWDDEQKGIRFVVDNNFWPKKQSSPSVVDDAAELLVAKKDTEELLAAKEQIVEFEAKLDRIGEISR